MSFYGPSLPPHLRKQKEESDENLSDKETNIYGPTIPEETADRNKAKIDVSSEIGGDTYGPPLPPHLLKKNEVEVVVPERASTPESGADSDSDVYGPLPPSQAVQYNEAEEFERRARKMKEKLTCKGDAKPARETWMLELPESKAKEFGLGPRSFSAKAPSDAVIDKDGWTDTPGSTKSGPSQVDQRLIEAQIAYERDQQMQKIVEEQDSDRRKESLLQKHKKDLKRKSEEESGSRKERKTFDRDRDLSISSLDAAQKKAIIKKAQQLDSKFSTGSQKFL